MPSSHKDSAQISPESEKSQTPEVSGEGLMSWPRQLWGRHLAAKAVRLEGQYWGESAESDPARRHLRAGKRTILLNKIKSRPLYVEAARQEMLSVLAGDSDAEHRRAAVAFLHEFRITSDMVPFMLELLEDEDMAVRARTVRVMGEYGLEPELIVPALKKSLSDAASRVRWASLEALSHYGKSARSAIPEMLKLLRDPLFACEAAESLSRIIDENRLSEHSRFLCCVARGEDSGFDGLRRARQMGRRLVPVLERFLLASRPWATGDGTDEVFLNAVTVYWGLGATPSRTLREHLKELAAHKSGAGKGSSFLTEAREIAVMLTRSRQGKGDARSRESAQEL